tara:strand:- start:898 stop:1833 length:936 start_codon:yes stop_codon:yes gene_type:complete
MKISISQIRSMVEEAILDEKKKKRKKKKKKKKGGKKDACYHKVKARYDVWPSAYASGALVKCRKVGAANWGNKSKKEGIEQDPLRDMIQETLQDMIQEADPKKGTGKKPKGSGRRLYTDEDPSDTVSVKFRTVQDIKDTLSKSSFKSKSHKRQSQIINLIHQRSRAAYQNAKDPEVKARLKKAFDYAKERKEASKKKTKTKTESVSRDRIKELVEAEIAKIDEKKRKLTAKPSSETSLRDWFGRKGAKGSKSGWVDCNTCRKDKKTGRKKCSACGRESGEKRAKYPKCRPTPSACSKKGNYGKKSKAGKKG